MTRKRFGSCAARQPTAVAAKVITAQGREVAKPQTSLWALMKEIHDHIRIPTNGRPSATRSSSPAKATKMRSRTARVPRRAA